MEDDDEEVHTDPADGMTVYGGNPNCHHSWEEMPGEPPVDVCVQCGGEKY